METLQEATANHESSHIIIKGKRTKRQRVLLLDPPPAATTSSTSSAEISGSTTEEEEDMANCLILLARGRAREPEPKTPIEEASGGVITEKFTSRRLAETPTTTNGKAGFYVYECKTCNKCFPSFQALGGHRASHKKPKMVTPISMLMAQERKEMDGEDALQISLNSLSKPILSPGNNTSSSKPKVHECSICRAEFSSGQALGGHMRRHRSLSLTEAPDAKKERNMLALDLNLPAPSDEDRSEFPRSPSYVAKPQLLFSASALVDCHF